MRKGSAAQDEYIYPCCMCEELGAKEQRKVKKAGDICKACAIRIKRSAKNEEGLCRYGSCKNPRSGSNSKCTYHILRDIGSGNIIDSLNQKERFFYGCLIPEEKSTLLVDPMAKFLVWLYQKQEGRCLGCGRRVQPGDDLQIDHIWCIALYPELSTCFWNYGILDKHCNEAKGTLTPRQFAGWRYDMASQVRIETRSSPPEMSRKEYVEQAPTTPEESKQRFLRDNPRWRSWNLDPVAIFREEVAKFQWRLN